MEHFVFIDESGGPGTSQSDSPFYIVGSIITEEVGELRKNTEGLRRQYAEVYCEIKSEFLKPPEVHIQVLEELMRLPIQIIVHVYDKSDLPNFYKQTSGGRKNFTKQAEQAVINHFLFDFAEYGKINLYIDPSGKDRQSRSFLQCLVKFAEEKVREQLKPMQENHGSTIQIPLSTGKIFHINLNFPQSHLDPGIQAADIISGAVTKYFNRNQTLFQSILSDLFKKKGNKLVTFPQRKEDYMGVPQSCISDTKTIKPGTKSKIFSFPRLLINQIII